MPEDVGATVLLTDSDDAGRLASRLAPHDRSVAWYPDLGELLRTRSLASIDVLVVYFRPAPKGALLATLGRMSLEYPAMQKVALTEGPLPLPIVEYLTACGIDMVWMEAGEETVERLASVVDRMHARKKWILAGSPAGSARQEEGER